MVFVFPGLLDVLAKRPLSRALISVDLPTLDRPMMATSGTEVNGIWTSLVAEKSGFAACLAKKLRDSYRSRALGGARSQWSYRMDGGILVISRLLLAEIVVMGVIRVFEALLAGEGAGASVSRACLCNKTRASFCAAFTFRLGRVLLTLLLAALCSPPSPPRRGRTRAYERAPMCETWNKRDCHIDGICEVPLGGSHFMTFIKIEKT